MMYPKLKRQANETDAAFIAYSCYAMLPANSRSVRAAFIEYTRIKNPQHHEELLQRIATGTKQVTPSGRFTNWAKLNKWRARVAEYDSQVIQFNAKQKGNRLAKDEMKWFDKLDEMQDEIISTFKGASLIARSYLKVVVDRIADAQKNKDEVYVTAKEMAHCVRLLTALPNAGADIQRLKDLVEGKPGYMQVELVGEVSSAIQMILKGGDAYDESIRQLPETDYSQ